MIKLTSKITAHNLTPIYPEAFIPLMLLKVLIYAYIQGIYSSRKIARVLQENITFMRFSKYQVPDFRTINRFRKEILEEAIENIFAQVVKLLVQLGYVNFDYSYTDGTKGEANANKYLFV